MHNYSTLLHYYLASYYDYVNCLNSTVLPDKAKCFLIKQYTSNPCATSGHSHTTSDVGKCKSTRACWKQFCTAGHVSLLFPCSVFWSDSVSCWFAAPLFSQSQDPSCVRTTGTLENMLNPKQGPLLDRVQSHWFVPCAVGGQSGLNHKLLNRGGGAGLRTSSCWLCLKYLVW